MKIAHLLESIDPAMGGPVQSVPSLAVGQARNGHSVVLACHAGADFDRHLQTLRQSVPDVDLLRIVRIPVRMRMLRALALQTRVYFRQLAAENDVVHVHGMWRPFCVAACQETLKAETRLVIAPHGMLDPWSVGRRSWRKQLALDLFWRRFLREASFVHALNDDEARLMMPVGIGAPIRVIPNGIFPDQFRVARDGGLFRKCHPVLGESPYVLFLSRLHFKKGLDYLIDAFAIVCQREQQTHLVIAGPDEGMRGQVEHWIRERGLQARVHLMGPIYGETKLSALAGALCFCLPSRQEGFSMAICEALASRSPVVISDQCHFPEVAAAGAGMVVPLSAGEIAAALEQCINDAEWRRNAAASAHALITTRYSWEAIARDMCAAYVQATAGKTMDARFAERFDDNPG